MAMPGARVRRAVPVLATLLALVAPRADAGSLPRAPAVFARLRGRLFPVPPGGPAAQRIWHAVPAGRLPHAARPRRATGAPAAQRPALGRRKRRHFARGRGP